MVRDVLDDLAAFAVVARERSFKRAATELGLSTSMLSYTINRLEKKIGVRLLQRNSRSVGVTADGERLLQTLGPALENIETALNGLGRDPADVSGTVRITATRQAYDAVIRPVLATFGATYPNATIEVLIEYEFRDIVASRFDAGIRLGEKLEKDMIALGIGPPLRMAVVGSPAYFARHAPPRTPHELAAHRCVGYRMRSGGALLDWEFRRGEQAIDVKVDGPLIVNEPELASDMALEGQALAYVLESRVRQFLADGRLVEVLEDWQAPFPGFFLYYPSRRQIAPALGALVGLLRGALPEPQGTNAWSSSFIHG